MLASALVEERELFREHVLLSTCMRSEVYLEAREYHRAVDRVTELIAQAIDRSADEVTELSTINYGPGSARHLYRVASGLDSRILGEGEILTQVRLASESASRNSTMGPVLKALFKSAIEVGKEVRTSTRLSSGNTSIASAAARLILEHTISEGPPKVLVIGGGQIGTEAARVLSDKGASVGIVVRDPSAREDLFHLGLPLHRLVDIEELLVDADAAIFATRSDHALLESAQWSRIRSRRSTSAFMIDLSSPRNVAYTLADEPGLTLLDLGAVEEVVLSQLKVRQDAVKDAEMIIERNVEDFSSIGNAGEVSALLGALYKKAEEIRATELRAFLDRSPELPLAATAEVERLTAQMVAKLLHDPASRLRHLAKSERGRATLEELRELFEL